MDTHFLSAVKVAGINETTVEVIDHKTGKEYPDHADQRSLYALGALLMYPDAVRVIVKHWYLDTGSEGKDTFTRDQLPALQSLWLQRIGPMLKDKKFKPEPGQHCRWCHFRKANNGPCQY
jgi:hypothetical protein